MSGFRDQFAIPKTYRKTSVPTPGATTCHNVPKSGGSRPDAAARRMQVIENETESFQIQTTDISLANRIKTLRAQKEWSQKDLATRASVKIDIIRDYESGKGMPDQKIIARLEQVLGGPLRDKPAGKKK